MKRTFVILLIFLVTVTLILEGQGAANRDTLTKSIPPGVRHGTVIKVTEAEFQSLLNHANRK